MKKAPEKRYLGDEITGAGYVLKDWLEDERVDIGELVEALDVRREYFDEVLAGKWPLTFELAGAIEKHLEVEDEDLKCMVLEIYLFEAVQCFKTQFPFHARLKSLLKRFDNGEERLVESKVLDV